MLSIHSWYTVEGTITYHQDHTCCLVFETASGNFELVLDVMARSRSGVPMDAITHAAIHWIRTCLEKHPKCPKNESPASYPTRLLVIEESIIRLSRPSDEDTVGPYAALSYCWGPDPQFIRLTTSNRDEFRRGIAFSDLPIAFQEAIDLLKSLSIRLVWIDALCIIQDSDEDWLRESAKMYQVYTDCYLALSLSRSASPSESCLAPWVPDDTHVFSLDTASLDSGSKEPGLKLVVCPENYHNALHKQPFEQRAWAFQERILAPRVLSFGQGEMFWSCSHLPMASEAFLGGCPLNTGDYESVQSPVTEAIAQLRQPSLSVMDSMTAMPLGEKLDVWDMALESYRKRRLTYPEQDNLVAIAAIARALTPPDDPYIAGHFKSTLPRSLAWESTSLDIEPRRKLPGSSPTWSWASVHNHAGLSFGHELGSKTTDLATLQSYHLKPMDHNNPYGQIPSATLTLQCNTISLFWTDDFVDSCYWFENTWSHISSKRKDLWNQTMIEGESWILCDDDIPDHTLTEGTELQVIPLLQINQDRKNPREIYVQCLAAREATQEAKVVYNPCQKVCVHRPLSKQISRRVATTPLFLPPTIICHGSQFQSFWH